MDKAEMKIKPSRSDNTQKTISVKKFLPGDKQNLGIGSYEFYVSETINILMVGRSQTGKSTVVKSLLDPQQATDVSGFSDTRNAEFYSLILRDMVNFKSYQVNIIDTPGLKEVRKEAINNENNEISYGRSDEELLKLAALCAKYYITTLSLICFVSKAGETHTLDVECFNIVKKFLGEDYGCISIMLLTHCDRFGDSKIDKFENDIREHPSSKAIADYCKLGFVRYGAISLDELESLDYNKEEFQFNIVKRLEKIERLRGKFVQLIMKSAEKQPMRVENLRMVSDIVSESNNKAMLTAKRALIAKINNKEDNFKTMLSKTRDNDIACSKYWVIFGRIENAKSKFNELTKLYNEDISKQPSTYMKKYFTDKYKEDEQKHLELIKKYEKNLLDQQDIILGLSKELLQLQIQIEGIHISEPAYL